MQARSHDLTFIPEYELETRAKERRYTRLAAITTLYASATAYVFLRPELGVFTLGLCGAVFEIALRVRALLYAGVSFVVLNVLGQLVRFYPDDRLGKAIALMAVGAAITAAMLWFNMKREAILKRIRIAGVGLVSCD